MHKLLTVAALAASVAVPAAAQTTHEFHNPCNRGPVPHWSVINETRAQFIEFLQEVRPTMPHDIAALIAYEVCADMSLVGRSDGLTDRLNLLLRKHGY